MRREIIKIRDLCWPLVLMLSMGALAETFNGRVVSISDGDTLTLLDAANLPHKIRLLGIDAPESNQDFGQKAKSGLSALSFGQPASADCRKRDPFRRELCVVMVGGKDLGLAQLRAGMAWRYLQDTPELSVLQRSDYEHAEFNAKIHRQGLWNSKNPVPPWDWRHE